MEPLARCSACGVWVWVCVCSSVEAKHKLVHKLSLQGLCSHQGSHADSAWRFMSQSSYSATHERRSSLCFSLCLSLSLLSSICNSIFSLYSSDKAPPVQPLSASPRCLLPLCSHLLSDCSFLWAPDALTHDSRERRADDRRIHDRSLLSGSLFMLSVPTKLQHDASLWLFLELWNLKFV